MLVLQCITNSMVAVVWQHILSRIEQQRQRRDNDDDNGTSEQPPKQTQPPPPAQQQQVLPHRLLLATAACYVGAMVCSNEAIVYVSYPVNVLVKSCKLIPTMVVGQIMGYWNDTNNNNNSAAAATAAVAYSTLEWYAALLISTGIGLFHWDRIRQQQQQQQQQELGDHTTTTTTSTSTSYGMMLLLVSLTLDGVLNAFQNKLKKPTACCFKAPNAVETMLWINVYATMYLIPLAMWSGQWNAGMDLLFMSTSSTTVSSSSSSLLSSLLSTTNTSLILKVALLNATVAAGQIFIFLTIIWYTPVITTTITTTRKFLTILLSVWTYGHAFSAVQWIAVVLVFAGLYLAILMVHQKHTTTTTTISNGSNNVNNNKTKMD